jgi:hypothetical protein
MSSRLSDFGCAALSYKKAETQAKGSHGTLGGRVCFDSENLWKTFWTSLYRIRQFYSKIWWSIHFVKQCASLERCSVYGVLSFRKIRAKINTRPEIFSYRQRYKFTMDGKIYMKFIKHSYFNDPMIYHDISCYADRWIHAIQTVCFRCNHINTVWFKYFLLSLR